MASAAFRMTPSHDFVAGAVLLKHVSIFAEVSQNFLVLEVRIFGFRGSLAEKTLVLEVWNFTFCDCLAEFARFGSPDLQCLRKPGRKNALFGSLDLQLISECLAEIARLWKPGSSVFEEASQSLTENAPFPAWRRFKNAPEVAVS